MPEIEPVVLDGTSIFWYGISLNMKKYQRIGANSPYSKAKS